MKTKILILCTGNSCRSQMAQGWLQYLDQENILEIYSAGLETHGVNANAVKVMAEVCVDISQHTSNHMDEYKSIAFDYVITVYDHAKENCPYFPSTAERIHQNFTDPAKASGSEQQVLEAFRKVRDEIKVFTIEFNQNL